MRSRRIGKWYFGWNIVVVSSIITLLTVGTRLGIGPFLKPMAEDLQISRTMLSAIVAVSMLVYGIGMPVAGRLLDRFSTRSVLLMGVGMVAVSIVWTVLTNDPVNFLLSYGILLSLGLSFTSPVVLTPVTSRWFTRRRGQALFYLATGSMAGIAVMTPLFTLMIQMTDWRQTLIWLAVLFVAMIVPAAIFVIRDDPPAGTDEGTEQGKPGPSRPPMAERALHAWTEALKTRPFWQICIGLFACGFSMNLLASHGVPMLTDHGFAEVSASFGIGLIGIVAMFSTVMLGVISDRIPRKNMLSLIYLIRGLGFLSLVLVMTNWQLFLVSAIGGFVWAGSTALSSAILGDLYGVRHLGVLYGLGYFGHQIGGALGSFLGGWGYETFGTHLYSFGMATVVLVLASLVSFRLPLRMEWKRPVEV
ncbi:MFS transporter [Brevibacillus massiliensis]|uniref:MFS transporter n=1 Tax=Brevibacillus massiliensis TaxID=1118054 RepID=UPI0002E02F41|nr:MFS transporter [Brevibacillus massiliensis]